MAIVKSRRHLRGCSVSTNIPPSKKTIIISKSTTMNTIYDMYLAGASYLYAVQDCRTRRMSTPPSQSASQILARSQTSKSLTFNLTSLPFSIYVYIYNIMP